MNEPTFRAFSGTSGEWDRWLDEMSGASAYQYHSFVERGNQRFQVLRGNVPVAGGVLISARMLGWPGRVLAVHRGPVGDLASALDALERLARSEGAWCIEVTPDEPASDALRDALVARDWLALGSERQTLRLDLRPSEEALLAGLESRGRYRVSRAAREGVVVRAARDSADLATFRGLIADMNTEKELVRTPGDTLSRVAEHLLAEPTRGVVLIAERSGEALGANLIWRSALRVEYLYGASRRRREGVGYCLQWAGIMWAKQMGARSSTISVDMTWSGTAVRRR